MADGQVILTFHTRHAHELLYGTPVLNQPYTLMRWSGSLLGSGCTWVMNAHYAATFDTNGNSITVTFNSLGNNNVVWQGDPNSNTNWATGVLGVTNLMGNGTLDFFFNGDNIVFDDTASHYAVNVPGPVTPLTLTNNAANDYTLTGLGSIVSGNLVKNGTGTLNLNLANNSYAGDTIINAGTLKLNLPGVSNTIPSGVGKGNLTVHGRLDLGGATNTVLNALNGSGTVYNGVSAGTAILTLGVSGVSGSFAGSISNTSGSMQLLKVGAGTQVLAGPSAFGAATNAFSVFLTNGMLQLEHNQALGSNGNNVTISNGVLDLKGVSPSIGWLAGQASGIVTNSGTATSTLTLVGRGVSTSPTLRGNLNLILTPPGLGNVWQTLNQSNDFTGFIQVNSGANLSFWNSNCLGNLANNITNSGTIELKLNPASSPATYPPHQLTLNNGCTVGGDNGTATNQVRNWLGSVFLSGGTVSINNGNTNETMAMLGEISGPGGFTKGGNATGTLLLAGTNTYTGNTTINAGRLTLGPNGSISNSPVITFGNGIVFDVSTVSGGFALNGVIGQTLVSSGVVTGSVTVASGAAMVPGPFGTLITLVFTNGSLTLNGGSTISFDLTNNSLAIGGGTNDLLSVVNGSLDLRGASSANPIKVNISLIGGPLQAPGGPYTLATVTGGSILANENPANLFVPGNRAYNATFSTNNNALLITLAAPVQDSTNTVYWQGDPAQNTNWAVGVGGWTNILGATPFSGGDYVIFDDTSTNSVANLGGVLYPASVTVNASGNYTLTGAGRLAGPMPLLKTNSGTLLLTGTNLYTGGTTIGANSGTVIANVNTNLNQNSLGFGPVSVGAGSTLQMNVNTTNGSASTSIGNPLSGTGLFRLNFAAGTAARNTYLTNATGLSGLIQLANAGLTADKWNAGTGGAYPAALQIDSGSQFFAGSGTNTFNSISVVGIGNTEGRGAIRLSGATSLLNGPLSLLGDTAIGLETAGATIGGPIVNATAGAVTLTEGTPSSPGSGTFSGVLGDGVAGGTLALTKTNTGTLILLAANTFSGSTTINLGAIQLNHSLALSNSTVIMSATNGLRFNPGIGTFTLGGLAGTNNLGLLDTLSAAITLAVGNNNSSTNFSGTMYGVGSLTKLGLGTLTLEGTNTYTGLTAIERGGLQLINSARIPGTSMINVNDGAVLDVSQLLTPFVLATNQILGGSGTVTGVVSSAGGILQPGTFGTAGTLMFTTDLKLTNTLINYDLAGVNTIGGGVNDLIAINGPLSLSGSNSLRIYLSGGSLAADKYVLMNGITQLITNGTEAFLTAALSGTRQSISLFFEPDAGNPATLNLVLSVTGSGGSLVWTGTNSLWDVNATYNWTNLATMTEDVFYNFDNVLFNDSSTNSVVALDMIVQPASISFSNSVNNYSITGTGGLSGSTGLGKSGSGSLTIGTSNDFVGNTIISGGMLQLGTGGNRGSVTGHITNNAALVFNRSDTFTTASPISGSGSVVNLGLGTNILTGTNTYVGWTTNIAVGTLQGTTASLPGNILNDGTLLVNQTFAGTLGGAISGNGSLVIAGHGGTVILTNANTFAGTTTITNYSTLVLAGTSGYVLTNSVYLGEGYTQSVLQIAAPYQQMTPDILIGFKSGTAAGKSAKFQVLTNSQVVGSISNLGGTFSVIENMSTGNGTFVLSNSVDNFWDMYLRNQGGGTLAVTKDGNASLKLSGLNISYTGPTLLKNGTLVLTNTTALSSDVTVTGGQLVLQSGTAGTNVNLTNLVTDGLRFSSLSPSPTAFTLGGLSGPSDLGLTNDAGAAITLTVGSRNLSNNLYSGLLSGTGSKLIKIGTGTLTLSAANTYAGGTTNSAGMLRMGADNVFGTGPIILAGNGSGLASDGAAARFLTNALFVNTNVQLGDVLSYAGSLNLSSIVDLGAGIRNLTNPSPVTFSGTVSNGGFNKCGADVMTFTGNAFLNAATEILNGTLVLDGATVISTTAFRPDASAVGFTTRLVVTNGAQLRIETSSSSLRIGFDGAGAGATNIEDVAGYVTVTNPASVGILFRKNGAHNVFNLLANGVADVGSVDADSGGVNDTEFNFNGGILRAMANSSAFFGNVLSAAYVRDGGAFFDSSNYNISVAQPLLNGGSGGLTKLGSGTLTLTGTNTYTGLTIVSNGTLVLASGVHAGGGAVINHATLVVGEAGTYGTLAVSGLTLNANSTNVLDLGPTTVPGSGSNDLIAVTGDVTIQNGAMIKIGSGSPVFGTPYTIITYTGTMNGNPLADLKVSVNNPHFRAVLGHVPGTPNAITVTLTLTNAGANQLVWKGDGVTNQWNQLGYTNQFSNAYGWTAFGNGDQVLFNDTATSFAVGVSNTVMPAAVTVNAANNYTLAGSGSIGGESSFTKLGAGTLILSTTNSFSGPVTVSAGVVKIGATNALGIGTGAADGTTIANGATLDLGGVFAGVGSERVTVSGAGVDGNGAIISSAGIATPFYGVRHLTLNGNTTLGFSNSRWDIGATATNVGSLAGNGYTLTLAGSTNASLNYLGETGLGDINVNNLVTYIQGDTLLGLSNKTLTIGNGATVYFWNWAGATVSNYNKQFALNGGSFQNGRTIGINLLGSVSLTGANTNIVDANCSTTIYGPITGPGSLYKSGPGLMVLNGTNTYLGGTVVNGGRLLLGTNSPLAYSPIIQVNYGTNTLDASQLPGGLVLNGGINQTLAVNGIVSGNVTAGSSTTIMPGPVGVPGTLLLTNSSSLTLAAGSTLVFDFANVTSLANNDLIQLAGGSVDITGSVTIQGNMINNKLGTGTYTLMRGASSITGAGNLIAAPSITNFCRGVVAFDATSVPGSLLMIVSGTGDAIVWQGNQSSDWNVLTTPNWTNATTGMATDFLYGDSVLFDDTSANPAVTVTTAVAPGSVLVSNVSLSYTFSGPGKITGNVALTKLGNSSLTLAESNDYLGGTFLNAGSLILAANNALPTAGTVTMAGNSSLDLQGYSQTVANLAFGSNVTNLVNGALGSLTVNGGIDFNTGPSATNTTNILIMTGLGNFTYSGPNNTFRVSANGASSPQMTIATLAQTNSITALNLAVGDNGSSGGSTTFTNQLHLGQMNRINANNVNVGITRAAHATLDFAPNWVSPTLILRGTAGGNSAVINMLVGAADNNNVGQSLNHVFDVTSGTLDAIIGNLTVGRNLQRLTTENGYFRMNAGTVIATNIILGQALVNNCTNGSASGTFFQSGGTVIANTMTLADNNSLYGTAVNGTLVLTNSARLQVKSITKGRVVGATNTATLTLNGTNAVLDLQGGSIGTNGIPSTYLTALNFQAGTLQNVAEINGGANLVKNTTGTLVLAGKNTYTGSTIVNDGILKIETGAYVTNSVNLTVQSGTLIVNGAMGSEFSLATINTGTVGGKGVIYGSPATFAGGNLAPGEVSGSASTLTFGNILTLNPASRTVILLNKSDPQTNDLVRAGIIQLGGTLVVTNLGSISSIQSGDTFKLFEGTFQANRNFTNFTLPQLTDGLVWNTSTITNNGTISVDSSSSLPVIVTGPKSQTNWVGSNITFTVTATGAPTPSYQWFFGTNLLTGATSSNLVLNSLTLSKAGQYSVLVTNDVGGTNATATLVVLFAIPPALETIQLNNQIGFTFTPETNTVYFLVYKTNLADINWLELLGSRKTNTTGVIPIELKDTVATNNLKFYRIGSHPAN